MARVEGGEEGAGADGVVEKVNSEVGMEMVGVVAGESRRTGRNRTTMGMMMGTQPTHSLVLA
jgi:cell division GTPase FtsZ